MMISEGVTVALRSAVKAFAPETLRGDDRDPTLLVWPLRRVTQGRRLDFNTAL